MSGFTKPQITSYNPTNPAVQNFQNQTALPFLQSLFQNPAGMSSFFQAMGQTPVNLASNGAIADAVNAGPGGGVAQGALQQAQPTLAALMGGGAARGLNFSNGFSELQNPYGALGGINPALGTIAASAPGFDEQRQRALADLQTAAPNRFSGGFVREGTDAARKSLQDYNAFAAQALQQGITQQQASQQMGLNFALGARQLQQGATQDTAQNQLQRASLLNQSQLGGLGALGSLAQSASGENNNFLQFLLGAGGLGLQQQQAAINPILQLMTSGLQYTQPQGTTPIVGNSPFQNLLGLGQMAGSLAMLGAGGK